jgi:hypothetical protein
MDLLETTKLIIWVNQFDPFVQANDSAADIWHGSMYQITYNEAEEAIVAHYRANPGQQAQPGAILKRALNSRAAKEAGTRAIEVPQTRRELEASDGQIQRSWRSRNPEEWDRLMAEGREARRADLAVRGRT